MRELRIPIRKTNPIHNDVSANTIFLLLDQPSGEANTTSMLINKIDEVAIKAVNGKQESCFLSSKIPTKTLYHLIPLSVKNF
ncbi:hypothetical protein OROMI_034715 [Orobanche minor]